MSAMTTNYERSEAYAENGQYARAQTLALLAIADRLEDLGGAPAAPAPEVVNDLVDDLEADLADMMGANDGLMRRLEQMTRWRDGQARAAENAENRVEELERLAYTRLRTIEKAARDDIIVHEMEAAYLRAGLEDLLESPYLMSGNAVQAILNHTWTPA